MIKEELGPLTEEEVNTLFALFETVKDDPLEAVYVLAVTAGLRKGELLGLKWSGINLDTPGPFRSREASLSC